MPKDKELPKFPELSNDAANKLLENIFDACQQEPNSIPLNKLALYSEYRRERYGLQKFIIIAVMIVFLALPLCFISPDVTIERLSGPDEKIPIYQIRVKSDLPISRVSASVDDHGFPVYESGDRLYTVQPTENGELKVKVTLANRQYSVVSLDVDDIDYTTPILVGNAHVDDMLVLDVEDGGAGIDWNGIYAETLSGKTMAPLSYDEEAGEVIFEFPEESVNIFIPDFKENVLQLVLSII